MTFGLKLAISEFTFAEIEGGNDISLKMINFGIKEKISLNCICHMIVLELIRLFRSHNQHNMLRTYVFLNNTVY